MNAAGASPRWADRLVPPLIDLTMLMGMIFLVPWLGPRLFQPTALNHFLLLPGFVLILAGILSIRSLPRIYLLRATGDRLGLAFYLLGVAAFLWNKLPPVNETRGDAGAALYL